MKKPKVCFPTPPQGWLPGSGSHQKRETSFRGRTRGLGRVGKTPSSSVVRQEQEAKQVTPVVRGRGTPLRAPRGILAHRLVNQHDIPDRGLSPLKPRLTLASKKLVVATSDVESASTSGPLTQFEKRVDVETKRCFNVEYGVDSPFYNPSLVPKTVVESDLLRVHERRQHLLSSSVGSNDHAQLSHLDNCERLLSLIRDRNLPPQQAEPSVVTAKEPRDDNYPDFSSSSD